MEKTNDTGTEQAVSCLDFLLGLFGGRLCGPQPSVLCTGLGRAPLVLALEGRTGRRLASITTDPLTRLLNSHSYRACPGQGWEMREVGLDLVNSGWAAM